MSDDLARRLRHLHESVQLGYMDQAAYTSALDSLRAQYGEARVDACLRQLTHTSQSGIAVNISTDSGSISGAPVSVVGRAENVFPPAPDPAHAREQRALRAYLQRVVGECHALPLSQIDSTDAGYQRPVELARVYIGLHTTDSVELSDEEIAALPRERRRTKGDAQRPTRPLSALEALSETEDNQLILLGAPGSGKSTFVSHLALCLAGAHLQPSNETALQDDWLSRLPGWRYGPLLPIRLMLRDMAAFAPLAQAPRGSVKLLEHYLAAVLDEAGCADALAPLTAALRDGTALLLLDGLDEVVGDAILLRVAQCIVAAAQSYRAHMLVTCRILDYQEDPRRQLSGFPTRTLADLDEDQINQFVQDWYGGLAASGRRMSNQAAECAEALRAAIRECNELHDLAGWPLLLTVMVLVHAFKGRLPDSRAQLYAACIDLLLLRWRQPDNGPDLLRQIGLESFRETDLRALMAKLGFLAHQKAERALNERRPSDLSEDEVVGVLAEEFARYDPQRRRALAEVVFHALARGNGLLLKRGPATYTFAHCTFQEFLAGQHLKGQQRDYMRVCRELAPHPHWHEALALMVGYQVLEDAEIERPLLLADQLLERGPQEKALAGELLFLIGRERAARYSQEETRRIWPKAIQALRALSTAGSPPAAPAPVRARAGLALGQLCYGGMEELSRPGPAMLPDPRLPFAMIGTPFQRHPNWVRCLEQYWCDIAPGPFWSGDDHKEQLRRAVIRQPYRIARYPVTNADYARFLAANGPDGYDPNKPWWTDYGRAYLLPGGQRWLADEPEQITHPRFWATARYNGPIQPMVGISWYEAAAFCCWLTDVGHAGGWLPHDQIVRLPTWHEWERAARHTDQRRYPWGMELADPERANYRNTGIGAPSPIGCFPAGAAVCGTQDMVGNVMEWTASLWEDWAHGQKDFTASKPVALSYSYFDDSTDELRCGARFKYNPYFWIYFYQGFRVIQSQALIE